MNDRSMKNERDDDVARKLNQLAEQTHANAQFAAELEERLRSTRRSKPGWLATSLREVSPALRWAALMILLALALSWSIKTLVPAPQPSADNTPVVAETVTPTPALTDLTATPAPDNRGYDFRGAKLHLEVALPEGPGQANVYRSEKDEPATAEEARALADRFGIQGEMYTAPGLIYGTTDYAVSDGKQFLQVHSTDYFLYTADMVKNNRAFPAPSNPDAEGIIRDFLLARGFDFPFRVFASEFFGGYIVQPLSPDSIPMQYESYTSSTMRVVLDDDGQVLTINASLLSYDSNPVGQYGIISAQEAFQKLLDDRTPEGKMEFSHSSSKTPLQWYREYPDEQSVTIFGNVTANPAADPNSEALVLIDGIPVVGNISGMETLEYYTFVRATGEFVVEGGIRTFRVESWDTEVELSYLSGTLRREGERVILASDDGSQYLLVDPPPDLPLDGESRVTGSQFAISGVIVSDGLFWTYIQHFDEVSGDGGGGGGGGAGFYRLNLSGTPVPFPTPTAQPGSVHEDSAYTIQEGDTVLSIAEAFGVTPEKIVEANEWLREESVLMPGKILVIPAAEVELAPTEYIVQENDTAASIALNHGISLAELQRANNLPPDNLIVVGQKLIIPPPGSGRYVVQEGDTLSLIAQSFGITAEELMRLNGMTEPVISVGQILIVPSVDSAELQIDDLRGFLSISLHKKTDGAESREYSLIVNRDGLTEFYLLQGTNLSELDAYHGLPVVVSGTAQITQMMSIIQVDSYEIPFPDLQFQILKGTQRSEQVEGQTAVIFTTEDGKSYVEFLATTDMLSNSFIGLQGDSIQQEVLIIPDETFGGIPVARIYQGSVIQEGAPEMQVQANQIPVIDDTAIPDLPGDYTPPDLTIDRVELVYFARNPFYQVNDPSYDQRSPYIQPAWHFQGQYEDGTGFDMLVQALQQEFLLPELESHKGPG